VHPAEIDIVGLQSFQTGFQCLHHALAVIAGRTGIVAGRSVGVFCRQNDTVAMSLDEVPHDFSARSAGVEIRSVSEVSACLAIGFIDFLRFVLR
jgi:hypothetical protein